MFNKIKKIAITIAAELKLVKAVNIKKFSLAAWVREDGPEVAKLREYIRTGKHAIIHELKRAGAVLSIYECHNLITTAGRTEIAKTLANQRATVAQINYGALGTVVSPNPTNASTQLGTEAFRKVPASQSIAANIAYVDFFFAAADCNGTYTEFGNFIDGAAGANTGSLFSYFSTGGWVKSNAQSLFVSCQYTIN